MGLSAAAIAAWASVAVGAASATASNVRANRAAHKKPNKTAISTPTPDIDRVDDEEEIKLGSDRASSKSGRSTGRRKLMAPKASSSSTGLQI